MVVAELEPPRAASWNDPLECDYSPARLAEDPVEFQWRMFGTRLWEKQVAIAESVRDNRKTLAVTGHGIGKTRVAAGIVLWFLQTNPGSIVVTTATTWGQVRNLLWSEIRALYSLNYSKGFWKLGGTCNDTRLENAEKWFAVGLSTKDPNSFQGFHAEKVLVVADEAQGIPAKIWDAFDAITVSTGSRILALVNPVTRSGRDYEHYRRGKWKVVKVSCLEHPNVRSRREVIPGAVTWEWVQERREEWGEESPIYQSRVLGEYPSEEDDVLLPLSWLERSCEARKIETEDGVHLGVDPARYGADYTAWCLRKGWRVLAVGRWQGVDLETTKGRVIQLARKYGVPRTNVHVDVVGLGAGLVDGLRAAGYDVDAVNNGGAPRGEWRALVGKDALFKNRRAELHWVARLLFQRQKIRLRPEWTRLMGDLCAPRYSVDGAGKIVIESKDEIKDRLGHSPDEGDAFICSLSKKRRPPRGVVRSPRAKASDDNPTTPPGREEPVTRYVDDDEDSAVEKRY